MKETIANKFSARFSTWDRAPDILTKANLVQPEAESSWDKYFAGKRDQYEIIILQAKKQQKETNMSYGWQPSISFTASKYQVGIIWTRYNMKQAPMHQVPSVK